MRRTGLTLIETLVVTAIISILIALIFPVYGGAKHSAKVVSSVSKLRQLHANLMLYQSDYDGGGSYGTLADMGLPNIMDHAWDLNDGYNVIFGPSSLWKSPCGLDPSFDPTGRGDDNDVIVHYIYRPLDGGIWPPGNGLSWEDYSKRYQENSLVYFDVNCDDHSIPYLNPQFEHKGLGVLLSGQVVIRNQKGSMYDNAWWTQPVSNGG
jgi:prepilin-type N-terminal cleavage/methylation domain-containing protein